jgi:hypothetical protein
VRRAVATADRDSMSKISRDQFELEKEEEEDDKKLVENDDEDDDEDFEDDDEDLDADEEESEEFDLPDQLDVSDDGDAFDEEDAVADGDVRIQESRTRSGAIGADAAVGTEANADDNELADGDVDVGYDPNNLGEQPRSKAARRRDKLKEMIRSLDPRLPFLFPKEEETPQYRTDVEFYESESEDDLDADTNTVGDVPMEW